MRWFVPMLVCALLTACSREKEAPPPIPGPGPVPPTAMPAVADGKQVQRGPDGLFYFMPTRTPYTGKVKLDFPDGRKAEINFKAGNQDGIYRQLHPNGKVRVESMWVSGSQEGDHKEFFPDGSRKAAVTFKNGVPHGEQRQWYPNGKPASVMTFEDGDPHGEQREWFPNGKPASVMMFEKGKPVGVRKEWDEKGVTEFEIHFENGQPGERKVVSNSSLTLDEKERKYLWDTEHHGTLLRKYGFKPFIAALRSRNPESISKHLHEKFRAAVPADGPQVTRPIGLQNIATRWDLAGENRKPLDRAQFLAWLGQTLGAYGKEPKAKISLMQFAPVKRYELEGLWRGNVQMKFFGETKPGKPRELVMYIDIEVNKPTKDGLQSGAWLMAAEFTRLKESRAQQYLMVDVAAAQGVNVKELKDNWNDDPNKNSPVTGGVFVCDFNHDGVSDFLVTDAKLPRGYKLYQGDAKGQFKDVSRAVGLTAEHAYIASWVDLDGDGWEDLVLNSGQIFQNQKGRFTEVTGKSNYAAVGNIRETGDYTYQAIADYDGDGLLDIYLFRTDSQPLQGTWIDGKVGHKAKNQLLRNKGNWQFEDVTEATGTDGGARSTFSSVWFDANNDQRPDLYVIHEYGNGLLLVNQEDGTFKAQELADRAADFGSMGLASGDFNNDGRIDLYVASMYSKSGSRVIGNLKPDSYNDEVMSKLKRMVAGSQLYQNNGDLNFEPVGKKYDVIGIGWAYAPTLADLDNDGFLDLHATTGFISRTRDKPDG